MDNGHGTTSVWDMLFGKEDLRGLLTVSFLLFFAAFDLMFLFDRENEDDSSDRARHKAEPHFII